MTTWEDYSRQQNIGTSGYYSKPAAQNNSGGGVFWRGTDGMTYVKGAQGTNQAGVADANTNQYWTSRGFIEIADPLRPNRGVLTINGGPYDQAAPGGGSDQSGGGGSYDQIAAREAERARQQAAAWEKVNTGRDNLFSTTNTRADLFGAKQRREADAFGRQYALDTTAHNQGLANAELGKMNAYSGIMDMIGRGVQSAGTMLANKNASNSSAADAIARAYSILGQREAQGVEQQYGQDMDTLGLQGQALINRKTDFESDIAGEADAEIQSIVSEAGETIMGLNEILADVEIPIGQRLQVEQLKEQVKQNARDRLGGLSQYAQSKTAGAKQFDQTQRIASANEKRQAGGRGNTYDYTAQAPMMASGGVSSGGQLPLYSNLRNRNREERY